jgi:spore coat protein CotH
MPVEFVSMLRYCSIILLLFFLAPIAGHSAAKPSFCQLFPVAPLGDPQDLYLSELVVNSSAADFLDGRAWVELHNRGASTICLGNYTLVVDQQPPADLPDRLIGPGEFIVLPFAASPLAPPSADTIPLQPPQRGSLRLVVDGQVVDALRWKNNQVKKGRSIGRLQNRKEKLYPTPGYANVPYELFSTQQVFTVKIHLEEKYYRHLLRYPVAEHWYKAEMEFNGARIKDIAVSTKGSATLRAVASLPPNDPSFGRYSFKVDFNRIKEQKFMGMKRLHFNSGYADPTMMRDPIAHHIMKIAGVPASRFSYVDLWIAGRHMGLYQMLEPVDGEYVERYFPEDAKNKGDLYKAFSELLWHEGQTVQYYTRGRFPQLKLITNEETVNTPEEGKALMRFLQSINSGSREYIDTDLMTRYIAAMTLISNYDSHFANLGNFFLYERRAKNTFTMLPWDFNLALGRSIRENKACPDPIVQINHPTIAPLAERPMIARVLESPQLRADYHRHLQYLLDEIFNPAAMEKFTNSLRQLIDPYVKQDPTRFYTYEEWQKSFTEIVTGEVDEFGRAGPLLPFIEARHENVKKQLAGELFAGSMDSGPCAKWLELKKQQQAGQ